MSSTTKVASGWVQVRFVLEQNLVDGLDNGASLCVYYREECVVDLCGGWKDSKTKKNNATCYYT